MVLIRVQAIMDDRNRLDRTTEDIFRSIADGFNRPKTGIETIVTITTDFVQDHKPNKPNIDLQTEQRFGKAKNSTIYSPSPFLF